MKSYAITFFGYFLFVFCEGAYGTAVLYKKKDDDSLVILKEINLHELNVSERQLAQNEVMHYISVSYTHLTLPTNREV